MSINTLFRQVDDGAHEVVELLQALVRIPSVNTGTTPTGNETPVAEYARDWLSRESITAEVIESELSRGSLVARMQGRSPDNGLLMMSHLDVVPVENENKWRFAPFSGTLHEGKVYGRGASDCKALLAAQMYAMAVLKRSHVSLTEGLVLASGADEEHGGRRGFGWLSQHCPEKIRARYAVNEGGGYPVSTPSGPAYMLNLGEKGRIQIEITIRGASAHAALPWTGDNPFFRLSEVLRRLQAYAPVLDTSSEMFGCVSLYGIDVRPTPENIDDILATLEGHDKLAAVILRAASRLTITPTMVKGGVKSNSVPDSIRLTCDVRTLPYQSAGYVRAELAGLLEGLPDIDVEMDVMGVSNASPWKSPFVDLIKRATVLATGRQDIHFIPGLCVGFSDSRFMRPLGVDTYDFEGMHPDEDALKCNVHGTDEYTSVASLLIKCKTMLALAHETLV
ncbi:MAG: M20/M25/M40 family metallo-hydrolase [SAR202 cluster bacterium]|nr:M20/M25/M40 family metallo-hydrolase [SAR202 cluster bacterium]